MARVLLSAALIVTSAGLGAFGTTAVANADHGPVLAKVDVCHANGGSKEYVRNTVDASSISNRPNGHDDHADDIIPPFHYLDGTVERSYPGKNFVGENQAIHLNGCNSLPALSLDKTGPLTALVGSAGSYVLQISNGDAGPATTPITVTDTVPVGVTITSVVPEPGAGFSCTTAGQVVSCTTEKDLRAMSSFSVTVNVVFATPGSKTNTAVVRSPADLDTRDNEDSVTTEVAAPPAPDLTLAKGGPDSVVVGDPGAYVLTVTNSGNAATVGTITVVDALPAGVTTSSAALLGSGCALTAAQQVTCTSTATLAPNGTVAFTIPVTFGTVGDKVNTATVSGGGEDDTDNNGASKTTQVGGIPDVTLAKDGPDTALVDAGGSYVLTVTNAGDGPTSGTIEVVDTLPTGVTAGDLDGTGCVLTAAQEVTCTSTAALAPAGTVAFTIPVTFSEVGSKVNSATVTGGGERVTTNNDASKQTRVTAAPEPDLALTKTGPASRTAGQTGEYALTVTNVGSAAATAVVTVTDALPAGVTVAPTSSGGFDCSVAAGVVTCTTTEDLAVGASRTILLPATFSTPGVVQNTATVDVEGDGNTANDTGSATTSVTAPPPPGPTPLSDLSIVKTGPASVAPGGSVTWLLTVTNIGDAAAPSFEVTDTLPVGVTLSSLTGPLVSCTLSPAVCTSTQALLPGASTAITAVGTVPAGATGSVVNTALVTPLDATPLNNTDTLVTPVVVQALPGAADLSLTKQAPQAAVQPGGRVDWVITVTNGGTAAAGSFTVEDDLAQGLTLVSAAGDGFDCQTGPTVACAFAGPLGVGEQAELLVSTTLDTGYALGSVTNTAVVVFDDATPGNNSDDATTGVERPIGQTPPGQGGSGPTPPGSTPPGSTPIGTVTPPAPGVQPTRPVTVGGPTTAPAALPRTGAETDSLLALAAALSVVGLVMALVGRRRQTD